MTSNMIYLVALDVGSKCPHKIHLNTQCQGPPGALPGPSWGPPGALAEPGYWNLLTKAVCIVQL